MTNLQNQRELDPIDVERLFGRSLLTTMDWSSDELETLLSVASVFEDMDAAGQRPDLLPRELAYALFFDQSTRTRSAWAGAAARLGMQPVIVDGRSTQLSHGESAFETGTMLGMNVDALGVRHDLILGAGRRLLRELKRGVDDYQAATGSKRAVPIVNLQCDLDHPTQTLADLMWLRERFRGCMAGRKITISWAFSPSYAKPLSVPQGLLMLLTRFGARVTLAHPEGYSLLPECMEAAQRNVRRFGGSLRVVDSMDEAFEGADAVYPKSWGPLDLMQQRVVAAADEKAMADIEEAALARNALHRDWICDERRMSMTAEGNGLYMHCLPADIGAEVTEGVMERNRLLVSRQANKKIYVIMALLAAAKVPGLAGRLEQI